MKRDRPTPKKGTVRTRGRTNLRLSFNGRDIPDIVQKLKDFVDRWEGRASNSNAVE
jgi:hypothetical protein